MYKSRARDSRKSLSTTIRPNFSATVLKTRPGGYYVNFRDSLRKYMGLPEDNLFKFCKKQKKKKVYPTY